MQYRVLTWYPAVCIWRRFDELRGLLWRSDSDILFVPIIMLLAPPPRKGWLDMLSDEAGI